MKEETTPKWTACLYCDRGPKGKVGEQCSCGWRARTTKLGCYAGEVLPGYEKKNERARRER